MSERGGVWGVMAFVAALLVGAEVAYLSFAGFNPDDLHVC